MTVLASPITEFEAKLAAACAAGKDARRDGVTKRDGMRLYEDGDLQQAWRVGWDSTDAELRERP